VVDNTRAATVAAGPLFVSAYQQLYARQERRFASNTRSTYVEIALQPKSALLMHKTSHESPSE
jgi:hypothetical protein